MKSIAVFCGSSDGASTNYRENAIKFGKELAKHKITLIYGGASVGIMGAVADTVLNEGGRVIGVMPSFLEEREISHKNLTELIIVDTMHERKSKMADLADGFVALPGGPGTLEEYFEIFTWAQLGLHKKPCGILNINHYFDPLIELLNHMVEEEFLDEKYRSMSVVEAEPKQLLKKLHTYEPPKIKTYLNKRQT